MKITTKNFIISSIMEFCGLVLSVLCVVFFFVRQTMLTYLFGTFGILFIIAFVLFSLVSVQSKRLYDYLAIGLDFFVSVIVCAFMIANIKDDSIRTIVLSLASAIYGGLLTLIGVAWTIKKSDKDRKIEEEKKAEPLFTFNMLYEPPVGNSIKKVYFPSDLELEYRNETYVELENSERSTIRLVKIFHDGKWFDLVGIGTLLPNKSCYFSFKYNSPLNIYLVVKDVLNRDFYFQISVLLLHRIQNSDHNFCTVRGIEEIEKSQMDESAFNNID